MPGLCDVPTVCSRKKKITLTVLARGATWPSISRDPYTHTHTHTEKKETKRKAEENRFHKDCCQPSFFPYSLVLFISCFYLLLFGSLWNSYGRRETTSDYASQSGGIRVVLVVVYSGYTTHTMEHSPSLSRIGDLHSASLGMYYRGRRVWAGGGMANWITLIAFCQSIFFVFQEERNHVLVFSAPQTFLRMSGRKRTKGINYVYALVVAVVVHSYNTDLCFFSAPPPRP